MIIGQYRYDGLEPTGNFVDVIRRTSIIAIELVAGLLGVAVLVLALLFWRLSTGPLPLAFATPYIERAVSLEDSDIEVKIQDMALVWAGWDHAFDVRVNNATVLGSGGKILASLPEISVGFSIAALFRGIIAPKRLEVEGLSATIERGVDGKLIMGFFSRSASAADQEFIKKIPDYIALLSKPGDLSSAFGYLDVIRISDVDVNYLDRLNEGKWHSPDSDIELLRGDDGLEAIASVSLNFGERVSQLTAHAVFSPERPVIDIGVEFDSLYPADIGDRIPEFSRFSDIEIPFSGQLRVLAQHTGVIDTVAFDLIGAGGTLAGNVIVDANNEYDMTLSLTGLRTKELARFVPETMQYGALETLLDVQASSRIDSEGQIERLELELRAGAGTLTPKYGLSKPFEFENFVIAANVRDDFDVINVKSAEVRFGKAELDFKGSARRIGDQYRSSIDGELRGLPMSDLARYWPLDWGAAARRWTITNIRSGMVEEGRVNLVLETAVDAPLSSEIQSISGTLTYNGLEVSYVDGFPKATDVAGTARFSGDRFDLDVTRGRLQDIELDHGVIHMTQLDTDKEKIAIDLVLRGPLASALEIANRKPLGLVGEVGLDPAAVGGEMAARLGLRFPLRSDVQLSDVRVSSVANLRAVQMKPGPFGFTLENSDLELKLSNATMKVAGQVQLNGVPLTVDWHEMFVSGKDFRSRYILSGRIDAGAFQSLGLPDVPVIQGAIETNLILTRFGDGRREVLVSGDLSETVLSVPYVGWFKPKGRPGNFRMDVSVADDGVPHIDNLAISAGDLEVVGNVAIGKTPGQNWRANLSKFRIGKTNVQGTVGQMFDQSYRAEIESGTLDLEPMMLAGDPEDRETPSPQEGDHPAISVNLKIDTLRTTAGGRFGSTIGRARFADGELDLLILKAGLPNDKTLQVDYRPDDRGHVLDVKSDDAGQALLALGWSDKLEGGALTISGQRKGPLERLQGKFTLSQFKMSRAPALARLLQVASLTGIFDALQRGLDFTSFDGEFGYRDEILQIDRSRAYGSSIGITLDGTLDLEEDIANLKGTVVPAYTVNRVLGQIPIIGAILTGGKDEGVFAASYGVNGPLDDPTIAVNPLSALAPGFLRNIFNLIGGGSGQTSAPVVTPETAR